MPGTFSNGTDALVKLLMKEGPFALYKGSLSPVFGNCGQLSLIYGFDGLFKKLLLTYTNYTDPLPYKMLFISSFLASQL